MIEIINNEIEKDFFSSNPTVNFRTDYNKKGWSSEEKMAFLG